ncbi:MAG: hypothetical protein ACO2YJ_04920 [Methylophilaceae bacterium]
MFFLKNFFRFHLKSLASLFFALLLSGCGTFDELLQIGPDSVEDGRGQFNTVIAETNDQQLLLNLVKRRYGDNTALLEVNSVSTTLEWKRGGNLGLTLFDGGEDANSLGIGANGAYTERPTITYLPVKGPDLIKKNLSPLDPEVLILLSRSGWRMERVMRLTLNSINDLDNAAAASGPTPAFAPDTSDFEKLLSVIEKVGHGQFVLGYTIINDQKVLALDARMEMLERPEMQDFTEILKIDKHSFYVVNVEGNTDYRSNKEIDIKVRSLSGIEFYLSHGVQVPEEHIMQNKVQITKTADGEVFDWGSIFGDLFQIQSSRQEPSEDIAAVKCFWRGYWFYIDDTDIESKNTFMLLNQITALQSGNMEKSGPLLTLPVN